MPAMKIFLFFLVLVPLSLRIDWPIPGCDKTVDLSKNNFRPVIPAEICGFASAQVHVCQSVRNLSLEAGFSHQLTLTCFSTADLPQNSTKGCRYWSTTRHSLVQLCQCSGAHCSEEIPWLRKPAVKRLPWLNVPPILVVFLVNLVAATIFNVKLKDLMVQYFEKRRSDSGFGIRERMGPTSEELNSALRRNNIFVFRTWNKSSAVFELRNLDQKPFPDEAADRGFRRLRSIIKTREVIRSRIRFEMEWKRLEKRRAKRAAEEAAKKAARKSSKTQSYPKTKTK